MTVATTTYGATPNGTGYGWRHTARRAQRIAERVNGPYVFAMSQAVHAYARWMMVRGTDALDALQQASAWPAVHWHLEQYP